MVAVSRSIRPMEPISPDTDICTSSPITSLQISAARFSCSSRTVEKTEDIATDFTPFSFISAKNSLAASSSSGASSLPSYSLPPPIIVLPAAICFMSSAQSTIGSIPVVAGAPILIIPIFARFLRSTMALVHCVVPSIACLIRLLSTPVTSRISRSAPIIPS